MSIKKPNILLIMADQLAAPALPIYGHKQVIAPNINKLAENSVIFDNCYCNFPMCGPSRSSLHSSIYPHKMKVMQGMFAVPLGKCCVFEES